MAFVDVFVDIFDGFDRCTNLYIDVTVYGSISIKKDNQKKMRQLTILGTQVRVVRNDIPIIMDVALLVSEGATIVRPGILRITIISKKGLWFKLFRIML
jgi:hypothetical protein